VQRRPGVARCGEVAKLGWLSPGHPGLARGAATEQSAHCRLPLPSSDALTRPIPMDPASRPPKAEPVPPPGPAAVPAAVASPRATKELLEHLVVATHDLDRLQRVLAEAGQALVTHFHAAAAQMKLLRREVTARPDMNAKPLEVAMDHLAAAITTLQFQDLAAQLLEQAGARLRHCADQVVTGAATAQQPATAFMDTLILPPPADARSPSGAGSTESA
jgi:hypothetical protein